MQITADVTGSRSINAMNALSTNDLDDGADADIASIVQRRGSSPDLSDRPDPTLQTDGNFTAVDRRHLPD